MIRIIFRYTGALWLLQIVGWAFAHMTFQLWPVAAAVSLGYLYLAWRLARALAGELPERPLARTVAAVASSLLWLLPALVGTGNTVAELMAWRFYDGLSDLADFAMQTWLMPLMPLLSLLPAGYWGEWIPYYWGLVAAAPVLTFAFIAAAAWPVRAAAAARPPVAEVAAALDPGAAPAPGQWVPARRWQDAVQKPGGTRRSR